jgi:large subunit ribosomal protein L25
MVNYQLAVQERTKTGKSYARRLRAAQKVPAIVYGSGKPAQNIEVGVRDVEKALASQGSLIDLVFGSAVKTVIVKDTHRDPVRGTLQHLDFHEVDLTKKLEITVPLRIVGEDDRANDGGIVTNLLWEVTVLCLPTDIPDTIDVNVSALELDQLLTIGELDLPVGVEIIGDADEAVVRVNMPVAPKVEEEEGALEEEAEEAEGVEEAVTESAE